MIQQLLAEGSIDEDLVIQLIANDESEKETAREELKILTDKCNESQAEFKTAFEKFDTLYPYAASNGDLGTNWYNTRRNIERFNDDD